MSLKYYWRFYRDFLKTEDRPSAEGILFKAYESSVDHLMNLAIHFGKEFGRLPDELHNLMILSGDKRAKEYLVALAGRPAAGSSSQGGDGEPGNGDASAEIVEEGSFPSVGEDDGLGIHIRSEGHDQKGRGGDQK